MSYFLLNDETSPMVVAGKSFKSFDVVHASGVARLHDHFVPEAAVALTETFVRSVHEGAGLSIQEIRRGNWATGIRNDQDVLTITHAPSHRRRSACPGASGFGRTGCVIIECSCLIQ